MNRREALIRTSMILGYAVSASAISGVLSGCTNEPVNELTTQDTADEWAPQFFSQDEIELITELCETILPETDTPGARAANVHRYVDIMIKDHYQLRDQMAFRSGLRTVEEECQNLFGNKFVSCTPDKRIQYLTDFELKTKAELEEGNEILGSRPFFKILKELTWIGFFTSELIGEEYLNYDPIPGGYSGCTSLEETGNRSWSL